MKYLLSTVEAEVSTLIEEAKNDSTWQLQKYDCKHKEKILKGQVEDDWYRVTLTKVFTGEKEPDRSIGVVYEELD